MMVLGKVIKDWLKQLELENLYIDDVNWVLESDYDPGDYIYSEEPIIILDDKIYNTNQLSGTIYQLHRMARDKIPMDYEPFLHKYAKALKLDGITFECPKELTSEIIKYLESKGCKIVGQSK